MEIKKKYITRISKNPGPDILCRTANLSRRFSVVEMDHLISFQ